MVYIVLIFHRSSQSYVVILSYVSPFSIKNSIRNYYNYNWMMQFYKYHTWSLLEAMCCRLLCCNNLPFSFFFHTSLWLLWSCFMILRISTFFIDGFIADFTTGKSFLFIFFWSPNVFDRSKRRLESKLLIIWIISSYLKIIKPSQLQE